MWIFTVLCIWPQISLQLKKQRFCIWSDLFMGNQNMLPNTHRKFLHVDLEQTSLDFLGSSCHSSQNPSHETVFCWLCNFYSTCVRFITWPPCHDIVMLHQGWKSYSCCQHNQGWDAVILFFQSAGHGVFGGSKNLWSTFTLSEMILKISSASWQSYL